MESLLLSVITVVVGIVSLPFILFFCGKFFFLGYFRAKELKEQKNNQNKPTNYGSKR